MRDSAEMLDHKRDLIALSFSIVSAVILALSLIFKPSPEEMIILGVTNFIIMFLARRPWPRIFNATVGTELTATGVGLSLDPSLIHYLSFTSCCAGLSSTASIVYGIFILLAPIQVYSLLKSIFS